MTTDPIAAARAVLEIDMGIMLVCETCPEECNCHPPADMWRRRESGELICEGCADVAAMPVEDLHHAPRPDHVIRALLVALEDEKSENQRLREALGEIVSQIDQGGSGGKVFARDNCIQRARAALRALDPTAIAAKLKGEP